MQTTFTDELAAINRIIAERIGQQKFRIWFSRSTVLTLTEDCLRVGVPNNFIGGWIEKHFLTHISHAVQHVTGSQKKIAFEIEPQLSHKNNSSRTQTAVRSDVQADENFTVPAVSTPAPRSPLKLMLEDFVVGPKNQLAYNAATAVVREEKSPFNPLFFHGGYGVGKTHLLQGICNAVCQARPKARWLYVSAEDFANQYVLALKTRKLEAFRTRFRQMDLLAIDDIHFLASKNAMQEEFLHTFNTIDLAGKQIILASDAHPKMISQLCERLVSRFISGMVIKIESPDFETRRLICKRRARKMNVDLPDGVTEYIAGKIASNIRELEGALLKIVAFAALSREKITLELARQVLADHIARTDPVVHTSDIISTVTDFFGVSSAAVHSSKKDRTISIARAFCMYLTRRFTKMSYPEIGRLMGNKNHATVILANRKIEEMVNRNAQVRWVVPTGNRLANAKDVLDKLIESIS